MMDIKYLKGRLEHAKALEADIVKIDIEEFESLIKWIDGEQKRMIDAVEQGYKYREDEIKRKLIIKINEALEEGAE